MKTKNVWMAAKAACLGIICLGSCTQEEMAYQGGKQETTKLKVMTRAEGEATPPNDARIYLFNQEGKCTNLIGTDDINNNHGIEATPGAYKLIAIGSNDLSVYKLPDITDATDSSCIQLIGGKRQTDLLLASENITLDEGETTQIKLTLNREVICIKDICAKKIPADVTETEIIISPMYKNIRMNGKYTSDTDSVKLILTKDTEEGKWIYKGDSIFSLPPKGNPKVTLRLKTATNTTEYTYQTSKPLTKNHFVKFDIVYKEALKTYLCSSLVAPEWEGTDSVKCEFNEKDGTIVSGDIPVAGQVYHEYFVISVNPADRTAVLLRRTGEKNIASEAFMNQRAYEINKPNDATIDHWRLPTQEECEFFLKNLNIKTKEATLDIIEGSYYFIKDNKIGRIQLTVKNGKREITAYPDSGYDKNYIYRPVIDISY